MAVGCAWPSVLARGPSLIPRVTSHLCFDFSPFWVALEILVKWSMMEKGKNECTVSLKLSVILLYCHELPMKNKVTLLYFQLWTGHGPNSSPCSCVVLMNHFFVYT